GRMNGHELRLGSSAWFQSCGISMPREISVSNSSVACVAFDGEFLGSYTLKGAVRPEIDQLIQSLAPKCEIALLSGDNQRQRDDFRELFGGDARLHFEQSPHDKLGFIDRLQKAGRQVIMVGDGLNDAGALKQSEVGIAVISKAGSFSPACDVVME